MTEETPDSILVRFEGDARRRIDRRLSEVRRRMLYHLTAPPVSGGMDMREVVRELLGMSHGERMVFLRRVMPGPYDGPASLEGMEALESFVGNALVDDGPCTLGPLPVPSEGAAPAHPTAGAREVIELPLVLLPLRDYRGPVAGPDQILSAISANRDLVRRKRVTLEGLIDML